MTSFDIAQKHGAPESERELWTMMDKWFEGLDPIVRAHVSMAFDAGMFREVFEAFRNDPTFPAEQMIAAAWLREAAQA